MRRPSSRSVRCHLPSVRVPPLSSARFRLRFHFFSLRRLHMILHYCRHSFVSARTQHFKLSSGPLVRSSARRRKNGPRPFCFTPFIPSWRIKNNNIRFDSAPLTSRRSRKHVFFFHPIPSTFSTFFFLRFDRGSCENVHCTCVRALAVSARTRMSNRRYECRGGGPRVSFPPVLSRSSAATRYSLCRLSASRSVGPHRQRETTWEQRARRRPPSADAANNVNVTTATRPLRVVGVSMCSHFLRNTFLKHYFDFFFPLNVHVNLITAPVSGLRHCTPRSRLTGIPLNTWRILVSATLRLVSIKLIKKKRKLVNLNFYFT